jgi:Cof subfamily protein (haloacid dehalogenase superfamily)
LKYKLVVIDIDGTLMDKHGIIAAEDRAAVLRLTKSGVFVCLCTGRIIQSSRPVVEDLELDTPQIFFDGALIYNLKEKTTIYSKALPPEIVQEAVTFSREHDTYLELYSRDTFFAEENSWSDEVHRKFFRVDPTLVSFDSIWTREKLLKAEMVAHNTSENSKVQAFEAHFAGRLHFTIARTPAYPDIDFINIVNPEVTKGCALGELAKYLGVERQETVAIGDGLNDISLLKEAGLAVAMGNAFPEVKKISQYTTLDVDHHGVAAAIDHIFPR